MEFRDTLSPADILSAFSQAVTAHGGKVTDTFKDERRLLTRSVLPGIQTVRPGDGLQGGVALRSVDGEILIHPYLFRLVCKNGAIMAQTLETRQILDLEIQTTEDALHCIREAVETCCQSDVFLNNVQRMRTAVEQQADLALNLMTMISTHSNRLPAAVLQKIVEAFFGSRDRSRFGLINAVTATARDLADPEARWNLQALGGALIAQEAPDRGPTPRRTRQTGVLVS